MKNLPEINFATADPAQVELEVVNTVEQLLGRKLERSDPLKIFLNGVELLLIQMRLTIDSVAKQNLLYYATGDNLDHLGHLTGCERLEASAAVTTAEITLSAPRSLTTIINKGTRISAGDDVYFALSDDVFIAAGETTATCAASCTEKGVIGNGYAAGEIRRIVDPQPFIESIVNITTSEGGSDREDDEHYRERIRESVESFSCAGSEGAYKFHAKSVSAQIADVAVTSPTPGVVHIFILCNGGTLPGEELLAAVQEKLSAKDVRPLTDYVHIFAAEQVTYDLNVRYWINREDSTLITQIQTAAEKAVNEYVTWQASKIGRDLNPTELIYRLKAAGVKRVEVISPTFTVINNTSVAVAGNVSVTFAGLEEY